MHEKVTLRNASDELRQNYVMVTALKDATMCPSHVAIKHCNVTRLMNQGVTQVERSGKQLGVDIHIDPTTFTGALSWMANILECEMMRRSPNPAAMLFGKDPADIVAVHSNALSMQGISVGPIRREFRLDAPTAGRLFAQALVENTAELSPEKTLHPSHADIEQACLVTVAKIIKGDRPVFVDPDSPDSRLPFSKLSVWSDRGVSSWLGVMVFHALEYFRGKPAKQKPDSEDQEIDVDGHELFIAIEKDLAATSLPYGVPREVWGPLLGSNPYDKSRRCNTLDAPGVQRLLTLAWVVHLVDPHPDIAIVHERLELARNRINFDIRELGGSSDEYSPVVEQWERELDDVMDKEHQKLIEQREELDVPHEQIEDVLSAFTAERNEDQGSFLSEDHESSHNDGPESHEVKALEELAYIRQGLLTHYDWIAEQLRDGLRTLIPLTFPDLSSLEIKPESS